MKFPGKRKNKHYFPVTQKERIPFNYNFSEKGSVYVVGIDQPLVDIEAHVPEDYLSKYGIPKGQSVILPDSAAEEIYQNLKKEKLIKGEYPGGAIGNTLHNYSVISDSKSVLLGVINQNIKVGDYAYNYICNTSATVDLSYLQPHDGSMGQAYCFITPDGERSFGISVGCMNELKEDNIPDELIANSSILLLTVYLLRDENSPIFKSTMKAVKIAKENDIPIILTLGTEGLIQDKKEFLEKFVKDYVNVVAMNGDESRAFTGFDDPLLAGEKCLDVTDFALITVGAHGLYVCAHTDKEVARPTKDLLHSKSIPEYNMYEYSRAMLKKDCREPIKIYSHINPYMGGPRVITSTNGAGDASLSALIHDIVANKYHREIVPSSSKHARGFLSYSSISQISKYANRVSYEVIAQNSPRLITALPEREDSLEESYWDR